MSSDTFLVLLSKIYVILGIKVQSALETVFGCGEPAISCIREKFNLCNKQLLILKEH